MTGRGGAAGDEPLRGRTVGITAERRAEEFRTALERQGATVRHAPTIRIVPLSTDERLRSATTALLDRPADLVVVTTGQGLKGWISAATDWELGDRLRSELGAARLVVRGPKAKGAVRAEGLAEEWSSPEETNADVLRYLLDRGVAGLRVAVQLHGAPLPDFVDALESAGADVVELQPYRWLHPQDVDAVCRLAEATIAGEIDALAFTSAPAAANLLTLVREHGRYEAFIDALRRTVLCACVGPVTAAPLVEHGVPVVQPQRQRLGALVKLLAAELPQR
ncbi:uroporphyrinogen-III synthase [Haloechinothrix alba]|uniref:Uroporphyrinogen-III synthase n=1 Tax=Haloechinothrix alba TaxID=664784 RepID=A0A238VZA0_9PSEU|nr:uroporphyrinogen-III synthase [Haloechinothrix alba]SNR39558.1 uroporphyrinogen-III synthase [Haloechinothrix alba]